MAPRGRIAALRWIGRAAALVAVCTVALQAFFVARIALMAVFDPQSSTFQRSEIRRLAVEKGRVAWAQQWVDDAAISVYLKRAVIAAEDSGFVDHHGIEWDAVEQAWSRNLRAQARARANRPPRLVGGSTITQQLAKNLFLAGERTLPRKAQEAVLALALDALLSKRRILEIYLNSVEWGEGVFGAQAAARHYYQRDAARLDPYAAARLAVMLPAPKRFERQPQSSYIAGRAATILARMPAVELP